MIKQIKQQMTGTFLLLGLLLALPSNGYSQVAPGQIITSNLTLMGNLDASTYNGTALRVGANNITIDGAGFTITVNGNYTAIESYNYSGITIKNVTVVSTVAGQGTGVVLSNSNNDVIQNNTFAGLNQGMYLQGNNNNNLVDSNNFSGCVTGINSKYNSNSLQWIITNNTLTNTTGWAMSFRGTPAVIDGNDFTGSAYGLNLDAANFAVGNDFVMTWQGSVGPNKNTFGGHTNAVLQFNYTNRVDVSGWDFTTLYATGVNRLALNGLVLNQVGYSRFANNNLSGFSSGVYISGQGTGTTLDSNNFSGCVTGINSKYNSNSLQWIITNNTLTNTTGWAMSFRGTPAVIDGNDFTGSAYGLNLDAANFAVGNDFVMTWQGSVGPNKNTFGGHTNAVLQFNYTNRVDVSGWDFTTLYATGVNRLALNGLVLNQVGYSRFANNNLSGFGTGIYTQGTNYYNVIDGNDLSGGVTGIGSNPHNCNNVLWTIINNNMTGNTNWAISSFGGPAEISFNDFTGSANGVALRSANNLTYDVSTNIWNLADAATAFSIEYSSNTTIKNLNIAGNGGTGVYTGWNTSNIVIDSLETCGDLGVNLNRGNGNIVRNSSFANAGTGVYVFYATNSQILNNSFYNITTQVADGGTGTTISGSQTAASPTWCPAPPNTAPVANAGVDQTALAINGSASVTLDGSASYDADGDVLSYTWTGPFGTATGATPTVSLGWGYHEIVLTVDDGIATAADTVNISALHDINTALLTRTSWEKHSGLEEANGYSYGVVPFNSAGHQHGWIGEYSVATVPGASDTGWGPAPNGQTIGFYGEGAPGTSPSLIDDAGYGCQTAVDFTYFQTFVNIPANTTVTQFTIDFNGMDDGSRITIYNASYPGGIVDPGSYVYLGGSGTADLSAYVTVGENRIVVTQVDDCPGGNTLAFAQVTLNGASVNFNVAPTAQAGVDQSFDCVVGTVSATLDGSGSSDPDGDPLTYSWSDGTSVVSTAASFTTALGAGTHTFTLTVDDGNGGTASDEVIATVNADTEPPVLTLIGDNPLQTICHYGYTDPGVTVEDSCDINPTVVMDTSFVDTLTVGTYTVTYTATDASGNTSSIERTVEVTNNAPVVDNTIGGVTLEFGGQLSTTVDLTTVFSDADGHALTFSVTNSDAAFASSSITGSVLTLDAVDLGSSDITVTATDVCGASVHDLFTITVDVVEDLALSVVFASNSAQLKKEVDVASGNILVNNVLVSSDDEDNEDNEDDDETFELKIDKKVNIASGFSVKANRIQIEKDSDVNSDVYYNELDNDGDINGAEYSPLTTPLFASFPPFKSAPYSNQDVTVDKNQSLNLVPGDYGKIEVKDNGILTFAAGIYNVKSLKLKKKAKLRMDGNGTIEARVDESLETGKKAYVGPANGSLILPSNIIFYIAGNGDDDDDDSEVKLGKESAVFGTFYAPNSQIKVEEEASVTGALYGFEVKVDKESNLTLNSFFDLSGSGSLAKQLAWFSEPEFEAVPTDFALDQNYPNPFNPTTMISYALSDEGFVSIKVYDILGRQVASLVNRTQDAGRYQVRFDANQLSAGAYLYVLETPTFRSVKKMIFLK